MARVPGRLDDLERPSPAEVQDRPRLDRTDAVLRYRLQRPERRVEPVAEDAVGAGHQLRWVGEVPRALGVNDDVRLREQARHVAGCAPVVEMDVREDERCDVVRSQPKGAQPLGQGLRDRRGTGLDHGRPLAGNHECRNGLV